MGSRLTVSCEGRIPRYGFGDLSRMQELLQLDGDDEHAALLNSLPPHNWLRRVDGLVPARGRAQVPGMTVVQFLGELCKTGFLEIEGMVNVSSLRRRLWAALPRDGRLRALVRPLPWVWVAQLAELWTASEIVHTARVRVAAGGCNADLRAQLLGVRRALGDTFLESFGDGETTTSHALNRVPRGIASRSYATALRLVAEQYVELPFPPRRPADERARPIHSSLASLTEISHFGFGGRFVERFCGVALPFRVLVAGGGTGDATVQIAQELFDLAERRPDCGFHRASIVHLDLSAASVSIAAARLRVRGWQISRGEALLPRPGGRGQGPSVQMVVASLTSLPTLGLGFFDFINLCGVLHHVPDPVATLSLLRQYALKRDGAMGLMVYGTLGRRGVYEVQAMLRLLHANGNATGDERGMSGAPPQGRHPWHLRARVSDAIQLVRSLPPTSTLRRNSPVWTSDEVLLKMGDSGIFDLFLHSKDRPFTRPSLVRLATAADMQILGWLQAGLYDPTYWLRSCTGVFSACGDAADGSAGRGLAGQTTSPMHRLRQRMGELDAEARAELAELAAGHVRKHWAYLVASKDRPFLPPTAMPDDGVDATARKAPGAAEVPSGRELDLAPCVLNMSASTLAALKARGGRPTAVQTLVQGEPMVTHLPPLAGALLERINCRTPLSALLDTVKSDAEDEAQSQWRQLYSQLSAVGGFVFMTDMYL